MITLTITFRPSLRAFAEPSRYSQAVRDQFRGVPGVWWHKDRRVRNRSGYYRGDAVAILQIAQRLQRAKVCRLRGEGAPEIPMPNLPDLPEGLRDYQKFGVEWLVSRCRVTGGALLADDMGVGKTPQSIVAAEILAGSMGRVEVRCPAIVRRNWEREIQRWAVDPDRFGVMSYDTFRSRWEGEPCEAAVVILDEAHYLSSPKRESQRLIAIRTWLASAPARPHVILTTGTPIESSPRDLYHPLSLAWPGRWGHTKPSFEARYCDGRFEEIPNAAKAVWVADGKSNLGELQARLDPLMLRRLKSEVVTELPPITKSVIEIELSATQREGARRAALAINWQHAGQHKQAQKALVGHEKGKLQTATKLANDVLMSGGSPLVLAATKKSVRHLAKVLGAAPVTGEMTPEKRETTLQNAKVGVATMQSITTGINLTNFDTVIFAGLDWLPSTMQQAWSRVHRIGQTGNVVVYFLIAEGTLDEVVRERVIDRLDAAAEVVGAGDDLTTTLRGGTEEEILEAMANDVLGGKL